MSEDAVERAAKTGVYHRNHDNGNRKSFEKGGNKGGHATTTGTVNFVPRRPYWREGLLFLTLVDNFDPQAMKSLEVSVWWLLFNFVA
ncbi:hypothetical protein TNCV_3073101 [Trichonephila clavipes]|nr:hypothetical protein TNCV_3073101 [Trichonephila clavipes]